MNFKELGEKLSGVGDETTILLSCEDDGGHRLFDIVDVSTSKGTPIRLENGEPGFVFETNGSVTKLVINITSGF
jgi:hypothetical protein